MMLFSFVEILRMSVVGFIRTKVLQADKSGGLQQPFVAVNVKEAMTIPGKVPCSCRDNI